MTGLKLALISVISYLLGSLNFSIIFSKFFAKQDIRKSESGNAGATNMLRTYGKKFAAITIAGDVIKVAAAIAVAFLILDIPFEYLFKIPQKADGYMLNIVLYKICRLFQCSRSHFSVVFRFPRRKGSCRLYGNGNSR